MKYNGLALVATLACIAVAARVQGETPTYRQTALTYDYYNQGGTPPSPNDLTVPPTEGYSAPACNGACACDAEEETCDPWRLFDEHCGWQFYGFLNFSATANADNPASRINGPVTFLDKQDIRLNQSYFILEKKADTGGCCCWDWGGRIDLLYGTDYVFTTAAGLETNQNGTPHWNGLADEYGLALPQMYAEVAYGDLSVKLGHFYAIMGYQVIMANGNFFPTQPYTFQYGEPFTHTGAIANWKYDDQLTLHLAVVNGWDKFDAVTNQASVMGGFTYAPSHGAYTIFDTMMVGEEDGIAAPTLGTRFLNALVFTYNISDNWQYVFQNDVGVQKNGIAPGVDAEWYGVNQYLFYTVNECWKLGARAEWFRDDDGFRLQAAPVRLGGMAAAFGVAGLPASAAGNYYEIALGANWTPHANLVVRPELRWDWSDGTTVAPYDDMTKDSQFIAALDAILLF